MKTGMGPLALPVPTGGRAETLPDGSFRVVCAMPRAQAAVFFGMIAARIEEGLLEVPARVVVVDETGETATGIAKELGLRASADQVRGMTALNEITTVQSVGYDLACGCGLRVEVIR